ncbi:MAG: aspartate aminotransferase family protein [Planctomycetales bacterium]|nr:aspartate aminotransferase family protein [Planctomycetales bacterium]
MDQQKLSELIDTFFVCDKRQIAEIFNEFLSAMEAEERLAPGGLMSRNYETAQANPEIHTLPGNLKDARDSVFPFFWGTDGWYSKLHLENVKGPANYASLIGALACLLKNPNLCVDTYCLRSNELEVKAITSLANLVFYHTESPWGVFTMGGTISNLYGGKIGIEKVVPGAMQSGIGGVKLAGVVSQAAHYSNATLAGWLGMGTDQLHAVPVDRSMAMDLSQLEAKLDQLYQSDHRVAFVIATFGSTDAFGIDDIEGIRQIIQAKAQQYSQPVPQLHVDGAVGWVTCFLNEYDCQANPFQLADSTLPLIQKNQRLAQKIKFADSITIDFHKMGWGHYPASAFIVNRREDLRYLFRTTEDMPYFSEADYRHDPALFTLECSRPGLGPYSVMASLNGIGLTGYQMLVANAMELAHELKMRLEQLDYCKVLNWDTAGPSVVWWVLPKGRNAQEIFDRMERGELSADEFATYRHEIHRMFEKRDAMKDRAQDARLSYTSSMGYQPHGLDIPAWKAVFFNPKTDRAVVDGIIQSLENLV